MLVGAIGKVNDKKKIMDFTKYKNRKWEDLNDSEKLEWDKFTEEHQKGIARWIKLCKIDRCLFCKKYKGGLIIPMPYDTDTPFTKRLNYEYLVHVKTTHGFEPEMLLNRL